MQTRQVVDSFGAIEVPATALWGAQTARSLQFFAIGSQVMPLEIIHALAWIKWAAAQANQQFKLLEPVRAIAISRAAERVALGELDDQFLLSVWQTGSGTQSNMNVNEVIAQLASQALGGNRVHPNDEVNLGQSSNDAFPSAMHIAVALSLRDQLQPALTRLRHQLSDKAKQFHDVIKIGRTHLQDATPIRLGNEFAAYEAQLTLCAQSVVDATTMVHQLALGATAVGSGINTHPSFASSVMGLLARRLDLPVQAAPSLYAALSGHEALVAVHGSLKMLAVALIKIGNDIRLLASGPRAGIGELQLPQNEPGSSIMPGKVNPTQIEALGMVCIQVMGFDVAVSIAASQGQLELNTCKPLIGFNTLTSIELLSDAMTSFGAHCVEGITADTGRISQLLASSLMLVTALVPHLGYDNCASIVKLASETEIDLKSAAVQSGLVDAQQFDAWVDPVKMAGP